VTWIRDDLRLLTMTNWLTVANRCWLSPIQFTQLDAIKLNSFVVLESVLWIGHNTTR